MSSFAIIASEDDVIWYLLNRKDNQAGTTHTMNINYTSYLDSNKKFKYVRIACNKQEGAGDFLRIDKILFYVKYKSQLYYTPSNLRGNLSTDNLINYEYDERYKASNYK